MYNFNIELFIVQLVFSFLYVLLFNNNNTLIALYISFLFVIMFGIVLSCEGYDMFGVMLYTIDFAIFFTLLLFSYIKTEYKYTSINYNYLLFVAYIPLLYTCNRLTFIVFEYDNFIDLLICSDTIILFLAYYVQDCIFLIIVIITLLLFALIIIFLLNSIDYLAFKVNKKQNITKQVCRKLSVRMFKHL